MAAKLVIGGAMGGYSSYKASDGDVYATILGTVTGALSSIISGKILGAVVGTLTSGVNAHVSAWRAGDDSADIGIKGISGFAGGGTGAIIGSFFPSGWTGLGANVGNAFLTGKYGDIFSGTYGIGRRFIEQQERSIDSYMEDCGY